MAPMSRPVSRTSAIAVLRLREFSYSTLARWLKADESIFRVKRPRVCFARRRRFSIVLIIVVSFLPTNRSLVYSF